jgi:predicted transcriptional regulator
MAKKTEPKPKRLNVVAVRLDDDQLARLRKIAEREKRPVSHLIAYVLSEWLDAQEKKAGG